MDTWEFRTFNHSRTIIQRDEYGHVLREQYDKFDSARYPEALNALNDLAKKFNWTVSINDDMSCVTVSKVDGKSFAGEPAYETTLHNIMRAVQFIQKCENYYYEDQ